MQQTIAPCPTTAPTKEQVAEQIAVNHWQEHQQEQAQAYNFQLQMASQRTAMLKAVSFPIALVLVVLIAAVLVRRITTALNALNLRKHEITTAAETEQNDSDNRAEIEIAKVTGKKSE